MHKTLFAALATAMILSGCATVRESKINPFNWFGKDAEEEEIVVTGYVENDVVDDRPLVNRILSMKVDRAPGGAIVSAVGLPPYQGYWLPELVAENDGKPVNGVLTLQFRAYPAATATPSGTDSSREITVGTFLSDQDLDGVRSIVILGVTNKQTSRR